VQNGIADNYLFILIWFIACFGKNTLTFEMTLSQAELWTLENPVLYNCQVMSKAKEIQDIYSQPFGLRVFQKKVSGRIKGYRRRQSDVYSASSLCNHYFVLGFELF
jgi:hypothetical protein